MKFLSIDVGIKNLSFCLFDVNEQKEYIIEKWDNINIAEQETCSSCCNCGKKARFIHDNKLYCLKDAKKQPLLIPSKEYKKSFLSKQNSEYLSSLSNCFKLTCNSYKKKDLLQIINDHIKKHSFQEIKKTNASHTDLVTIGKNIQYHFDNRFNDISIDKVIIENQIGPLANKMKTIQGMISQYFIMKFPLITIDFISATNKLKDFIEKNAKLEYKDRKQIGIETCKGIIQNSGWFDFFISHNKKDDLSDCFLQGIWFINNK